MKNSSSIRRGTKWLLTGNISSQVLQFAFGVALARLLTPADFGLLVTIQIFTGFVGMLASGGMGEALVQSKEASETDFQLVFTFQLAIGIFVFSFFYLIAPMFAGWFGNPLYQDLLRISSLTFLLRPFSNRPSIQLRRAMRFKEIAFSQLTTLVVSSVVSISLAAHNMGVWSLVWGGLSGAIVNIAFLSWHSPWRPVLRLRNENSKRLSAYGMKTITNDLLVYFRNQTNNFIISRLLGPGPVGLFNKADSLSGMPVNMVGGSTYQTVFRAMSAAQDNLDRSRYLYFHSLTLVSLYCLPIYISLAWVTKPFIIGVYGNHWAEAAWPLFILLFVAPFKIVEFISGALVAARDLLAQESRLQFQAWLLLAVLSIGGLQFGLPGIATATVLASIYISVRLCYLALSSVNATMPHIYRALAPVLRLCLIQLVGSVVLYVIIIWAGLELPPLAYTVIMGGGTFAIYCAAFILFPPKQLVAEANRWRSKIGMPHLEQ